MPELPEIEALRRSLDDPVRAFPIERAGPAHVATLKTIDPPLQVLEGRRLARRRAARQASSLRDRGRRPGAEDPPHVRPAGCATCVPERKARSRPPSGSASRAAASSCSPKRERRSAPACGCSRPSRRRRSSRTWGRKRSASARSGWPRSSPPTRGGCTRCSATSARSPASAAPGRTRSCTPPVSPPSRSRHSSTRRRSSGSPARSTRSCERGLELRLRGAGNAKVYRIHDRLGEPCFVCETPIARVDYEEHTIYYCPTCQTGGRVLKDRRLSRLLR